MPDSETRRVFAFLPVTLHLETLGGLATPILLRGSPLPAERIENVSTTSDAQEALDVKILMGESRLASKNLVVGCLKLVGLPSQPRGGPQIRIRVAVDRMCVTKVIAEIANTEIHNELSFPPPESMSDEAITRMVSEGETAKGEDDAAVRRIEATNRAEALLATAENRLRQGKDDPICKAIADLGLTLQRGNTDEIRIKSDEIESLMSPQFDFDSLAWIPTEAVCSNSGRRLQASAPRRSGAQAVMPLS